MQEGVKDVSEEAEFANWYDEHQCNDWQTKY
jgi:hypothetical protein